MGLFSSLDEAMNLKLHDESLTVNGFDELRSVIFFKNASYIRWDVFQNDFYKSIFSLEYIYGNYLPGTTAQSEMFQEKRLNSKPVEVTVCFIISFVLNTWIFNTSEIFLL